MNIYQYKFKTLKGDVFLTSDLRDKITLVVNTASQCGFTNQYAELQTLYSKYQDQNFIVLAFPSNDFGGQEPGSNEEIANFCWHNFDVSFPILEKNSVLTENSFYKDIYEITQQLPHWNFHKYLIDKNGSKIKSFSHEIRPLDLISEIENMLLVP
jgi:glutathione peroxidase